MLFRDRFDAGRQMAEKLRRYAGRDDVLVLALPRGGVPVGYEVARAIGAPLDVFVVRKLGLLRHEELAMGAIASGGIRVLNQEVIDQFHVPDWEIEEVAHWEMEELKRREQAYRDDRPPVDVRGKVVVLVDDGLATGSTMRAAITAIRQLRPARIVVAVPVGSTETCEDLRTEADELVCASEPTPFFGVGQWYEDFAQTTDEDVQELLRLANGTHAS